MANEFDPYYQWLGISPRHRPPTHYRMLGIEAFEPNPDVIAGAADQRMAHVRTFQNGPHAFQSQEILNQLAAVRVCLLDPEQKAAYDAELRARMAAVRRAVEEEAARSGEGDDEDGGAHDLESFARLSLRVISLDLQRLRIQRIDFPAALEALGVHLEKEGHFSNELTAQLDALDFWRSRQATPDKPSKFQAWQRRRLERALGAAGWDRFGVAAAPPSLTARLKELSNRLIDLDEKIAKTNQPRLFKTFTPRNFGIAAGIFIALILLGCAGLPFRYALCVLVPLASWAIYLRLSAGSEEDEDAGD